MEKRILLLILLGLAGSLAAAQPTGINSAPASTSLPLVLDLSKYFNGEMSSRPESQSPFKPFTGRQEIDQLLFQIDGEVSLYDQSASEGHEMVHLDVQGIPVGCKFEELHLAHLTRWPDLPGKITALIRLNYEDGSKKELPIRYGVHLRDGWRSPAEETEALSDPDSKIW